MKKEIKEIHALMLAISISILLMIIIYVAFNGAINTVKTDIHQKRNEYTKVLTLYNKIKNSNSNKKTFNENLLIFVQKLGSLQNIKKKIVSVNTTDLGNNVEIKIVALNLKQILSIFKTIDEYKNIKIIRFTLKRNFSSSNLADLSITIGKTT